MFLLLLLIGTLRSSKNAAFVTNTGSNKKCACPEGWHVFGGEFINNGKLLTHIFFLKCITNHVV